MVALKMKTKWIISLCFLLLIFLCNSQEKLVYNGDYGIGIYNGIAKFEYSIVNNDTILNGKFEFGNALEKEEDINRTPFIVSGHFNDNLPDGLWTFKFGTFNRTKEKRLVNYQYVVEINGIQKSIILNLDKGVPNGEWITRIDSLQNSEVTSTLFKSVFNYENGIPQKSFKIENNKEFMVGRLLRNAVAHDVWSLYSKDGIDETESWKFNQGELEEILVLVDQELRQLPIDYGNPTEITTVNLDKHYLDIIELQVQQQDTSHVFDHGMSTLLKIDDENYESVIKFFDNLETPIKVKGFKVKVPVFPLRMEQRNKLDSIKLSYQNANLKIQEILEDSQINILKLNDPETAFLYNVATTLKENYLKPIGKLVLYQDEDVLRHIPRKKAIKGLWPNGFPEQIIKVNDTILSNRIYVLEKNFYDFSGYNLNSVLELAKFNSEVAITLKSQVDEILSSNKREEAFLNQEKQLIASARALKFQIDSLKTGLPKDIKYTLEQIKKFTDNTISSYSQMEENIDKLNYSLELTTCFKSAKDLALVLKDLPSQRKEIKTVYQDQVWNPFTATVMNEDVKKRITKAYNKQLLPYYLNEINKNLSCDNVITITGNLEKLNQKILALREEDTKKLERKLKRTNNPLTILNLLGLTSERNE